MRKRSQIRERREPGVEGANVRAVYLEMALNIAKAHAEEFSAYLVEGEHSIVNVPIPNVHLSMRSVRYTINHNLDLLGTLLSSPRANLFCDGEKIPPQTARPPSFSIPV